MHMRKYHYFFVKVCYFLTILHSVWMKRIEKCRTIDAAFNAGDHGVYLLSGSEYIKYNFRYNTEEFVANFSSLGISSQVVTPDAAFSDLNGTINFFKRCLVFRYRWSSGGQLVEDKISNITSMGLPCSVDAAVNFNNEISVFKGCQEWRLNSRSLKFEVSSNITDRGLPCNIDSALRWEEHSTLYIKGVQFWKYDDVLTGPLHIDLLNVCSWNLCGERDWMKEKIFQNFTCNGDSRLCPLKLNQVTLAGLHNTGSGFDGGFGFLDCYLRNHESSIIDQLVSGIRHLDIDLCYNKCGLLGSCHSFVCGGALCPIIKQLRSFLQNHREEIVTLNFNHEIVDLEKVFPALTRQLLTQLGPLLNTHYRKSSEKSWPKLKKCVKNNKRVFVFYAADIKKSPHKKLYERHLWIHSESLLGSTWKEFSVLESCERIVNITQEKCETRGWRELLEVSMIPTGFCIRTLANKCRNYYHQSLKACEKQNNSPNILLVDYPEDGINSNLSVFNAVYQQNVRNIYHHRKSACYVKVKAAVQVNEEEILFFSESRIITLNALSQSQIKTRSFPELQSIDAAYVNSTDNFIHVIEGCDHWKINSTTLLPVTSKVSTHTTCDIDTAVFWNDQLYTFKDCMVTTLEHKSQNLKMWGLPCSLDAVLLYKGKLYAFKDNNYWLVEINGQASPQGQTLDWNIDVVHCQN